MRFRYIALLIIVALCAAGFQLTSFAQNAPKPEITVAAAANLTEVAQTLGAEFEAQTKIHPVFSFASTAVLTTQIENSAPFDVFLSADAEHTDKLDHEGLLVAGQQRRLRGGRPGLVDSPEQQGARRQDRRSESEGREGDRASRTRSWRLMVRRR